MLLYTILATVAGLALAAIVALRRPIRELRDRRASASNLDGWQRRGGPSRCRLMSFGDGRG